MACYEFEKRRTYVSNGNKVYIFGQIFAQVTILGFMQDLSDLQMPCFPSPEGKHYTVTCKLIIWLYIVKLSKKTMFMSVPNYFNVGPNCLRIAAFRLVVRSADDPQKSCNLHYIVSYIIIYISQQVECYILL